MDPEELEFLRNLNKEERRCVVPSLIKNLEERSLGCLKKNVSSKEYRELIAEELLIEKEKYDELRCDIPGMPRSTFLMVFSPDGTKVASTHGNHSIYITDIRTGKNLNTLVGHPRTPWCIAFHPTSNQIVASGCLGGHVRIWDLSGGSELWIATQQTVIASIAFHPIERFLVIATSNEVHFWDWSEPEPFWHVCTSNIKEKVRYVAFDKLGQRLITGISNHSRWEYVRSSERTAEVPVRHLHLHHIASNRPVLRRGLFPPNAASMSFSNNVTRETRSRVPERERNITMSYRNLVRQYGRLVQRYLQLYRPPAMIDRGTDPMENTVATSSMATSSQETQVQGYNSSFVSVASGSTSTSVQETQVQGSISSIASVASGSTSSSVQETQIRECNSLVASGPSCSTAHSQSENSSQSNRNVETRQHINISNNPVCSSSVSRKHKIDAPPDNNIPSKKPKPSENQNSCDSPPRSNSPQPSTSTVTQFVGTKRQYAELIINQIINAKLARMARDRANSGIQENSTQQSAQNEELAGNEIGNSSQQSAQNEELAGNESRNQQENVTEHSTSTSPSLTNETEDDDNKSDQRSTGAPQEGDDNSSERLVGNVTQNLVCNTDSEELSANSTETNPENNVGANMQSTSGNDCAIPGTSRDQSARSTDCDKDQALKQIIEFLEIPRSLSDQVLNTSTAEPTDANSMSHSSSVNHPRPGTSRSSDDQEHGQEQSSLENMMMHMRRKAEDKLRARFIPLIQSRVPENDREVLIRLFEDNIRESRERARLRYRNMGQILNRQPSREPIFTSSDSSSSEDERNPLHMNFHVRTRSDINASSRTPESQTGANTNIQRSRGNPFPSGNNSYQNINNLESWVTSLFDDVDSSGANTNEMNADASNLRSSEHYHSFSDLTRRITSPTPSTNFNFSTNYSSSSSQDTPPNPAGSTSTGTTNSTIYSQARRERRMHDSISAFTPARRTTEQSREVRTTPRMAVRSEGVGSRTPDRVYRRRADPVGTTRSSRTPAPVVVSTFGRDEVIHFSELPNSEDDPFLTSERSEPNPTDRFHPFNPPPNLPTIDPENIGIGNMYSNIVQDLETSLNNARDIRTVDRPGEMSNMLSNFSNRLEHLMNQSEGILRNLRTSVEVLPENEPLDYGEDAPVPTASFNDSSFFVRDQRTESSGLEGNANTTGYDIRQNNATSDHTYPRNSDSPGPSSNLNESMSPLMNSLHLTLSHIQSQSRLLHRQVESIEKIDRAMVEVSQLQLMRLLLAELSTYVRSRSGESRSTSMSSVRQMMAGTRISDSNPLDVQNNADTNNPTPSCDPEPGTSTSEGNSSQGSARSRGSPRKTYPPSRLNRPRESGGSRPVRNTRSTSSSSTSFPSIHTFSEINVFTLIRMDRRLQSLIDDHSRFSHYPDFLSANPRRVVHEVGEHHLALRLRESIARTNRLIGNIFNANVVRNYRIDSSTSMRHGIERFYERNILSFIIDGISSHLDQNGGVLMSSEMRTRMQHVLQLAMMISDLLLLYTINSLAPTTDVNLECERRILATRISETCSTMIRCRQYRNYCNNFVQSLRTLRLMVSAYSSNFQSNLANSPRGYVRPQAFRSGSISRQFVHLTRSANNESSTARSATSTTPQTPERTNRDSSRQTMVRERSSASSNNSPLINACVYLARRQRTQADTNTSTASSSQQSRQAGSSSSMGNTASTSSPLINACLYLNRRQRLQESTQTSQNSDTNPTQSDNTNPRTRRRNSTDQLINAYLTAGRNRTLSPTASNRNEEIRSPQNVDGISSSEDRANRSYGFNPYRDIALITHRSDASPLDPTARSHNPRNLLSLRTGRGRSPTSDSRNPFPADTNRTVNSNSEPNSRSSERDRNAERNSRSSESAEPQASGSTPGTGPWRESNLDHIASPEDRSSYGSPLSRALRGLSTQMASYLRSRATTSNSSDPLESARQWRIPTVQVNDVSVADMGPSVDNSESDNNPTSGASSSSSYPRIMRRLALRSVSVYNPMGVLRPRLLHPLYATLNPFDADLEQREHIYDSDVISTVTPNHRIQVWDISDSIIPEIHDPLKNLVVRECKIHNDASVDIASDGSILVTLLPSGGYLNITNRLGVYSLRWETLGQCLYTTSFVHNAVSVSLSPLGRHLVVGLASRRVSILPNDRWMMASIFKIEEKDTPGDHLPFVRQIDRGTDERATSHKSVNCIRWLPISGQGLIYATNTGQLNIWT
ncbi:uncharacterized protein LOC123678778 isoform X2 [Harmonia axyridis]|uniref:uncharacterized protein LOC123678778 isoform X2 n=1 Tax=Harmonia axyridis TaxID=115357 RepID=UPI001E277DC5|nr:uncharacterized protein LOC123678778 isoform X2 [Harmonia axyridis]